MNALKVSPVKKITATIRGRRATEPLQREEQTHFA